MNVERRNKQRLRGTVLWQRKEEIMCKESDESEMRKQNIEYIWKEGHGGVGMPVLDTENHSRVEYQKYSFSWNAESQG